MKILQIGCGGIGSYLLPEIVECIKQGQISAEVTIADSDIVEVKNITHQNYSARDIGKNKAKCLAFRKRLKQYGIKPIDKRIQIEAELKGFNVIILCVDNSKTREMVIRYCHKKENVEFIDLRAEGRRYFAMPKLSLKENLKFIDSKDLKNYSCQEKEDNDKGYIQKGYKISVMIGIQMLLNLVRGHNNRTQTGVI